MTSNATQRDHLRTLINGQAIVRAKDLRGVHVPGSIIQRAVAAGELIRLGRGLYQNPLVEIDSHMTLCEVAKAIPKGVIAMVSAMAFHGLTDQMPRKVWVAIKSTDWAPTFNYPPIKIVRFADKYASQGIEIHKLCGIDVPIYGVAKTLADVFRNGRLVDRSVAIEGLRAAIEQRKATPGEIGEAARSNGAWNIMRPYLEALTFNG